MVGARVLMGGAAAAAALLAATGAGAVAPPLGWSLGYGEVKTCPYGISCSGANGASLQTVIKSSDFGANHNASIAITPTNYSGVTSQNYGTVLASADPGTGGLIVLPQLHAYTSGAFVNADQRYSWNFASAQGVQAFKNDSASALAIPIDAFVGTVDYSYTGGAQNNAFVAASLALLGPELLNNDALGNAWYQYSSAPGYFGQFAANCGTTGAIALGNPQATFVAPGAGSIGVTPTSCLSGAANTYMLAPGDTIFLWARLATFQAGAGVMDAAHTFTVGFNPNLDSGVRDTLVRELVPVATGSISTGVPEPGVWALMLTGFIGLGAGLRRRRATLA